MLKIFFRLRIGFIFILILTVAVSCFKLEPDLQHWSTPVLQNDPALVTGTLPNGFRYILKKNNKPANRVSMHLDVQTGSINETDEQQGLAHYLEHMLFNGSEHFKPGELVKYFQHIGMQFGADANAHTGYYETVYDVLLPEGNSKTFGDGLTVMKDYAEGALLLEEEVKKERNIILAEKRDRDSASYRMFVDTLKFELPGMRLTKRAPIGITKTIKNADSKILKRYYEQWYRPENMVLVAVGDYDISKAVAMIKKKFSGIKARLPLKKVLYPGEINHKGLKPFYFYDKETGSTSVTIEVLEKVENVHETYSSKKKEIINFVGNQILRNRLNTLAASSKSPFTDATAGSGKFLKYVKYGVISADCVPGKWDKTLEVLEKSLRKALKYGFTRAELDRVKKDYIARLKNDVKTAPTSDSTALARKIISDVNNNRYTMSPEQKLKLFTPLVESLNLEEVFNAFKKIWEKDHRLVLVTGNSEIKVKGTTPEEKIIEVYKNSQNEKVKPPHDSKPIIFPYLQKKAKGEIAVKRHIDDLDITTVDFKNGLRLNLKKTDFKSNSFLFSLRFDGGKKEMPEMQPGLITLASSVMNESALNKINKEDLKKALAGKNTSIYFSAGEDNYAYSGQSSPEEVELMFQLLYSFLLDQGASLNAYETTMEKYKQKYSELGNTIEGVMELNHERYFAGGDKRFGPPHIDEIQKISYEMVRSYVKKFLSGRKPELSVVGDFDPDEVIKFAEQYLSSPELFGGESKFKNENKITPSFPMGRKKILRVKTSIKKAMIYTGYKSSDYWDIYKTRRLSILAEVFSERLRIIVREKTGAAYSPFAYNDPSLAFKNFGVFNVAVSVSPDQVNRVEKIIKQISAELSNNGITEDELSRALKPVITSIKDMRQTNRYWLRSVLSGSRLHPERFEWCRSIQKDYSEISVKDINKFAKIYLKNIDSACLITTPDLD